LIRQFFKDSFLYGISSIVLQGIPILLLPVYVRLLPPLEYGAMEIITIFAALINITVALEIAQGFARYFPEARTDGEKREYASTALWFTVSAYGLFMVAALSLSRSLTDLMLHDGAWEKTIRVAIIATGLNGVYQLLLNQLRWELKPLAYASASITYILISVAAGIFLIVFYRAGVAGIFYGQMTGAIVAGCFAGVMGRKNLGFLFNRTRCREMLTFSLPLVTSSIAVILANYVDRIAIQNLMTLTDVGVYSAGFRVASIANIIMAGIYFSLTPLIYRNYRKETTPAELAKIFNYFLCGTLPVLMAMTLFAREILQVFTEPAYYSAWTIIPLLAVASIASRLYIFTPGLDIEKRTKIIALINIASALLNIFLNILLIPALGITGSALATLISATILFAAYAGINQRLYPIPFAWRKIAAACSITLSVILMGYAVSSSTDHGHFLTMAGKGLLLVLASVWIVRGLLRRPSHTSG